MFALMFFNEQVRGSARGVASADRLTDPPIKQARALTAGDSMAGAVSAGRVGAFVLGLCPFIGDSLGRAG
jgi:hypothetical protein